jgi:hypothetical protein
VAAVAAVAVAVAVDEKGIDAMQELDSIQTKAPAMKISFIGSLVSRFVLAVAVATPLAAGAAPQQTFATPEAAVEAFMAALKADTDAPLTALFGEEHKSKILDPDPAAARANRDRLFEAMQTLQVLKEPSADRRILVVGDQAWPVPFPIVRTGDRWRFATEEGIEELINRRVGGNERNAIYVLRSYLDAQRAYAARDRDGDGVLQYAQKVKSSAGRQDGLYWPADVDKGEEASPFGPLVSEGAAYLKGREAGDPYRGYYFRILTQQGKNAAGGAYNYVINGRMIAGFAMIAYPAVYGQSGVMTFIVSHNGVMYQRDLGPDTTKLAPGIKTFDPGKGWNVVKPE